MSESEIRAADSTLPPEIQPAVGPAAVDPVVVDDQADPWTRDRGIRQIDVFTDQPACAFALRIDQASARAAFPIEQQIDARADGRHLCAAAFPFVGSIVRNRRVGAAVPAARPLALDTVGTLYARGGSTARRYRRSPRRRASHSPRRQ
jgi:hypothetical protein